MPAHVLSKSEHGGRGLKLRRSLIDLKDAAKLSSKPSFKTLSERVLTKMITDPFVFVRTSDVVLCYEIDLILFESNENF